MGWRHLLPVTVEIGDVPATAQPVHGQHHGAPQDTPQSTHQSTYQSTHQSTYQGTHQGSYQSTHSGPRHRARAEREGGRSPALVEALARLEVATGLRDADAAARILSGLAATDEGQWLLRQCVAAGLREVADHIAEGTTPGDGLGQPATGVVIVTDPTTLRSVGPAA